MRRVVILVFGVLAAGSFSGCARVPEGLEPVKGFEADRYLGKWYEIARLDHSFERGLSKVTAEYSRRPDGRIRVVNRGYDAEKDQWRSIEGVATFAGEEDVASLNVTFFWPFSGAYNVIALDREEYEYAMVTGSSRSYFWILARRDTLEPEVLDRLLAKARQWGFATDELIFVEH